MRCWMTAQSIACGTCGAPVAYGRLSCPSCGELLASVAGARRTAASAASSAAPAAATSSPRTSTARTSTARRKRTPDVLYDVDSAPSASVAESPLALNVAGRDAEAELPWANAAGGPAVQLDEPAKKVDDGDLDDLLRSNEADEPVDHSSSTAGHAWAVAGASLTGPTTPAYMPRPNYARAAAAAAATAPAFAEPAAPPIDPPGAYVPPLPTSALPAGPPAPARAWAGYNEAVPGSSAASGPDGRSASERGVDASRLAEFVGSVSIAGAALAAVGFLLPWASVMIGSTGSGYFDRWGLAGPGHILVVLGILALIALSIVRNPIPTWIRTGIGGLAVGSLLLGLTWPYLLGPLDAAPGVLIDAIGAVALIGSGVLALVTDRHAEAEKPV
jgi:hypothetical protein